MTHCCRSSGGGKRRPLGQLLTQRQQCGRAGFNLQSKVQLTLPAASLLLSAGPKLLSDGGELLRSGVPPVEHSDHEAAAVRKNPRDAAQLRPIKEPRHMQFEIPEGAHVHIVIGKPASAKACARLDPGVGGELLALLARRAPPGRPRASVASY